MLSFRIILLCIPWVFTLAASLPLRQGFGGQAIRVTRTQAQDIGKKIWRNECGGSVEGLLSWNANESFASVGIGHFTWCPSGKSCPFAQSFPTLIQFMVQHGIEIPSWLNVSNGSPCPWKTRREFIQAKQSKRMKELQAFLIDTMDAQIAFMVQRLKESLPKILVAVPSHRATHVRQQFDRMLNTDKGLYALIDYVNFKGEGISHAKPKAGKKGVHGWGLLQVLDAMHVTAGERAVHDFVTTAKTLLANRAHHNPSAKRWLKGWHNRLDTYLA